MKILRVIICDSDVEQARCYEAFLRKLSETLSISVQFRTYTSEKAMCFDMDDALFCGKLDILFFAPSSPQSMEAIAAIRAMNYTGLVVLLGSERNLPYEVLFDARVFNYVQKGGDNAARFAEVFQKAAETMFKAREEILALSYAGDYRQISLYDIHYFETSDKNIICHYDEKEEFTFISSMSKIENQLKERGFLRVHQSFLVSEDDISQFSKGEILLRNGTKIPVGRKYSPLVRAALSRSAEVAI